MSRLVAGDDPLLAASGDAALARAMALAVPGAADGEDSLEAHRDLILSIVDEAAAPADRTTRPGHLTGSACVVSNDGRHVVLLLHAKLGRWLQPGGHADGDMNLARVAWREATEETGIDGLLIDPEPIDLDVHEVRPPREDPHLHLDVRFLVVAPEGAMPESNEESHEIGWFGLDDLDGLDLDAGTRRLVARAFDRYERLTRRRA